MTQLQRFFSGAPCAGLFAVLAVLLTSPASARLKIEITEGVEGGVPVAVLPFTGEQRDWPRTYSGIIASDLAYSGLFSLAAPKVFASLPLPDEFPDTYTAWHDAGIEKIVSGGMENTESGDMLRVTLFDVVQKKKLKVWRLGLQDVTVSAAAHHASDLIYEELTGVPGIFSTLLAFVSSERIDHRKRRYSLNIADADGHNIVRIFRSDSLLMSPSWSPDYKRVVYVSYENGAPELFIQELTSGERTPLSKLGPANSPDWSGDGGKIAYVSSRSGNPEIYVYDLPSGKVMRMTNSLAIDTEPSWAPNNTLYFTSDRSGGPQVYRITAGQAAAERITFEGDYNADLDVSPAGDKIAYVSARAARFSIVVRDLTNSEEIELSFGSLDERPRFSANGQLLSYLTQDGGRSALGLVTIDGVFGKLIPLQAPYVRAVSWSPLTRPARVR